MQITKRNAPEVFNNVSQTRIGLFVFFYTLIIGLLVQLIIIPEFFPEINSGAGLVSIFDSVKFHEIAVQMSEQIRSEGWKEWEFRPQGYSVSGIAAFVYTIFSPKPFLFLPINALLKAISALALYNVLYCLFHKKAIAYLSIAPLVFFPTSLQWDAQIHNDSFTVAGFLLVLLGWVILFTNDKVGKRGIAKINPWLLISIGATLSYTTRPYHTALMLPLFLGASLFLFFFKLRLNKSMLVHKLNLPVYMDAWIAIGVISLFFSFPFFKHNARDLITFSQEEFSQLFTTTNGTQDLPAFAFKTIVQPINDIRSSFRTAEGRSIIDANVSFSSFGEFLGYFPRSLHISLLAPFPNTWFSLDGEFRSFMRLISGIEMFFSYFYLAFLIIGFHFYRRKTAFLIAISFCLYFLILHGYVVSNVGTINRLRFPFHISLVCLGFALLLEMFWGKATYQQ